MMIDVQCVKLAVRVREGEDADVSQKTRNFLFK